MQDFYSSMIKKFSEISDEKEMGTLFDEIFTDSERHDLSLRWGLLSMLSEGKPQREIASELGISLCKITRGAKLLKNEKSIISKIFKKS